MDLRSAHQRPAPTLALLNRIGGGARKSPVIQKAIQPFVWKGSTRRAAISAAPSSSPTILDNIDVATAIYGQSVKKEIVVDIRKTLDANFIAVGAPIRIVVVGGQHNGVVPADERTHAACVDATSNG